MEKVSIIIPIYNGEKYLRDTIDSCVNQSYKDVEIVLVNDASTDGSEGIVQDYIDLGNIIYISNPNNMGMMRSCNRGIEKTTGSKIMVLGQDDILPRNHVENVIKCFTENDSFVVCNPRRMDEKGNLGELVYEEKTFELLMKDVRVQLAKNNIIPSTGLIMEKEKLLRCGGYDETYRNYGEWMLWINMLSQGDVAICSESNPYYRTHSSNMTSTFSDVNSQKSNLDIQKFWLNCQKQAIRKLKIKGYMKIYLRARYFYKQLLFYKNSIVMKRRAN